LVIDSFRVRGEEFKLTDFNRRWVDLVGEYRFGAFSEGAVGLIGIKLRWVFQEFKDTVAGVRDKVTADSKVSTIWASVVTAVVTGEGWDECSVVGEDISGDEVKTD
jgi:hypothetical protein